MKSFVIAATGPSLTLAQARDVGMARAGRDDLTVMTVNDAVYPLWFADIAYACDAKWWLHHRGLPGFGGWKLRLATPKEGSGKDTNSVPYSDVESFECSGTEGFDPRPRFIRSGKNSGYQAVHIAAHLGAERIILLGFDMSRERGTHWFGEHPIDVRKYPTPGTFPAWCAMFETIAPELRKRRIEVLNATLTSKLKTFPIVSLREALG